MHAEILSIGDEITSGRLLDTNAQWLSQRCEELGISVHYHTSVGDDLAAMVGALRLAIDRSDVVVATGGLGPTADDLTRDAIAQVTGRPLVLDPQALEHIRGLFARRQRPMPPQNEIQALFPRSSRVVPNPHGTAPGIAMEIARERRTPCQLFALPGVPAEMREMWPAVAAALSQRGAGARVIGYHQINCFGAGESQIEAMLLDLIRRGRVPRVGINASQATIILRITAEGASAEECRQLIEPTAAVIRSSLGNLVFGEGDEQLQHAVVRLLDQRNKTLATCEWGTGGLVANWLHEVPGGPARCPGGLVLSDRVELQRLLEVAGPPAENEISSDTVRAAAALCRQRFCCDLALAVGPFSRLDSDAAQPRPFCLALAGAAGVSVKTVPFAGHPALLRALCAKHALNMVRLALLECR